MSQQTALAVPKDRQEVRVLLDDGTALTGSIFLEYAPEQVTVHHKIAAFLEDGKAFFPLQLTNGAGTEFINKKTVRLMELNISADEERINLAITLMQTVGITAIFTDANAIKGFLMAEVPAENARLSDCLNLPFRFLHVKVENTICYISKQAVRKVLPAQKP
jgi:hypothetical protein